MCFVCFFARRTDSVYGGEMIESNKEDIFVAVSQGCGKLQAAESTKSCMESPRIEKGSQVCLEGIHSTDGYHFG